MVRSIEEQIRQAIEEGKFDHLPGKGKPLNLDQDPFEDPDWRLANKILKDSGFSLPWIETRKEIEASVETARKNLSQAWSWKQEPGSGDPGQAERQWQRAMEVFREQVKAINKRIFTYNMEVPSIQLQILALDLEKEINRISVLK